MCRVLRAWVPFRCSSDGHAQTTVFIQWYVWIGRPPQMVHKRVHRPVVSVAQMSSGFKFLRPSPRICGQCHWACGKHVNVECSMPMPMTPSVAVEQRSYTETMQTQAMNKRYTNRARTQMPIVCHKSHIAKQVTAAARQKEPLLDELCNIHLGNPNETENYEQNLSRRTLPTGTAQQLSRQSTINFLSLCANLYA